MDYSGEDNLRIMELAENNNRYITDILRNFLPEKAKMIVDFGAGDGWFARKVQSLIKKPFLCIEPADNMQKYLDGLDVVKDINELSSNSVDYLYSLNVLEHIQDDISALNAIHRVLKSQGIMFLYVPAWQYLYSSMDKKVGHYRRYSRAELIRKCQAAGFKVKDCRYVDFAGFFASVFFKYWGNPDGNINPQMLKIYDKLVIPVSRLIDKLTFGRLVGKNLYLAAEKEK